MHTDQQAAKSASGSESVSSSAGSLGRRSFLAAGAALAGGLAAARSFGAPTGAHQSQAASPPAGPKRVLRFAHATDIHVQPELKGGEGMAACFKHMMNLSDKPSLIITGGDLPMDTASNPEDRSRVEWTLFQDVLKSTVPADVAIHHTMGNHDIFGRDKKACKATGDEPFYGKRWFLQNFGYERTYRSFDQAGWHFVILDSIDLLPDGNEYVCRISGAQRAWLEADLNATPKTTPVVVVSHAPIMSVVNFFDRDDKEWKNDGPDLSVSTKRMHADCRELEALFRAHGNVKLCLSGHIHLLDRCEYNGITYICDGAVSGAKWKGSKRQTNPGYGLIDLCADGSFKHQYVEYGWVVHKG